MSLKNEVAEFIGVDPATIAEPRIDALQREASALITAFTGKGADDYGEPEKVVLLRVVARAYERPPNDVTHESVTAGVFSRSRGYLNGGGCYLNKQDRAILMPHKSGAYTINLGGEHE